MDEINQIGVTKSRKYLELVPGYWVAF